MKFLRISGNFNPAMERFLKVLRDLEKDKG